MDKHFSANEKSYESQNNEENCARTRLRLPRCCFTITLRARGNQDRRYSILQ